MMDDGELEAIPIWGTLVNVGGILIQWIENKELFQVHTWLIFLHSNLNIN